MMVSVGDIVQVYSSATGTATVTTQSVVYAVAELASNTDAIYERYAYGYANFRTPTRRETYKWQELWVEPIHDILLTKRAHRRRTFANRHRSRQLRLYL